MPAAVATAGQTPADRLEPLQCWWRTSASAVRIAADTPYGLAAGVSYGASDFKAKRGWRHAVQAGKEAAVRREEELTEELHDAGEVT